MPHLVVVDEVSLGIPYHILRSKQKARVMLILSKCWLLYSTGTLGFELLNKVFVKHLLVNNYYISISIKFQRGKKSRNRYMLKKVNRWDKER